MEIYTSSEITAARDKAWHLGIPVEAVLLPPCLGLLIIAQLSLLTFKWQGKSLEVNSIQFLEVVRVCLAVGNWRVILSSILHVNIPEVMKTGSANLNFLCNFSQFPLSIIIMFTVLFTANGRFFSFF